MYKKAWMAALAVTLGVCGYTTSSFALDLDSQANCQAIGGNWTAVTTPPLIGKCDLVTNYTVQNGDSLEISSAVSLTLQNYVTLTNNGRLGIARFGLLAIEQGFLINNDFIIVDDDARLQLWSGQFDNNGQIFNEGIISNAWQGSDGYGFYNMYQIDNAHGGRILNLGLFVNRDDAIMINAAGGTIENYMGSYTANQDKIIGDFINQKNATLIVTGTFEIETGGTLVNAGKVDVRGHMTGVSVATGASILNHEYSTFTIHGMSKMQVDGKFMNLDATVSNLDTGEITVNSGATFVSENALVYNSAGGTFINKGWFEFDCSRWKNSGKLVGFYISHCF